MFKTVNVKTSILLLALTAHTSTALAANKCESIFLRSAVAGSTINLNSKSAQTAWAESITALRQINEAVYGRAQVIEALATAILAKEFVWINGEPGAAKTFTSRMVFQAVLNSLPESDKKIFVLQFHKLIAEGKITGFPKFNKMMKEGKYEIETSSSLVGDKFLFLIADEAEKANPAVLNSLLSVLNERKAFLGSRVVESVLSSGVFTSNKTTGEFVENGSADPQSGAALLDRQAIKIHMPNQQVTSKETIAMYDMVKNPQKLKVSLPLMHLESLMEKIEISNEMMAELVEIERAVDRYTTDKANRSKEQVRYGEKESAYFPANQFSNRSVRRMAKILKASLIASQLSKGVSFEKMRLTLNRGDLALLAKSALYEGPARIKFKTFRASEISEGKIVKNGVKIESDLGIKAELQAEYSPYEGKLYLQSLDGRTQIVMNLVDKRWVLESKSAEFEDYTVDEASMSALHKRLIAINSENKVVFSRPKYEVDSTVLDSLLAKGTVKERTQDELKSIKADLQQFADILNQQSDKNPGRHKFAEEKLLPARSEKEIRAFRREVMTLSEKERVGRYYDWMVYEVSALKQRFIELEHSIEAHLTGILSGNHLYVFGPPGGAKTALAEVIIKAELKKMNADQVDHFIKKVLSNKKIDKSFIRAVLERIRAEEGPIKFERFLLQFHTLIPEGVLIGFPKIEKQLNEGIEEIETTSSLANNKFVFAVLDEVDKASPSTSSSLLSILNEGEVFNGNQLIKTGLKTAILTSNKMPSEFLDGYGKDRTAGDALLDRAPNKVFVSNKISSEEELTKFLINLEKGISPNWKGLLAVGELKQLVEQVKFESKAVSEAVAEIQKNFMALRIKKEEDSRKANKIDSRANPDYYVAAASSSSDRTTIKVIDQLKARLIINQLMSGVPFKNLRTTIEMKDLNLLFEGLGYWSPQKITSHFNSDGTIEFTRDSKIIDTLLTSGIVDSRVAFHLKMMKDEADDFISVTNSVVREFMGEYKLQVTKYPDLFPMSLGEKDSAGFADRLDRVVEDLARLRLEIEAAKIQGLDTLSLTALNQDYKRKESELVEYLKSNHVMTREQLREKMKKNILRLQGVQTTASKEADKLRSEQKEVFKNSTAVVNWAEKAVFHDIEPGTFKMGDAAMPNSWKDAEITTPFAMMATHVTQKFWATVQIALGERDLNKINPSYFRDVEGSQDVTINGIKVRMSADRPVEQVNFNEAKQMADGLTRLSKTGDAAVQNFLAELIPGHQKGDIYDLPTPAQYEYVKRNMGKANETYFDRNDVSELPKHALYNHNTGLEILIIDKTLPVGSLEPRRIGNQLFYHLEGNVSIWTKDFHSDVVAGGKDPQGPAGGDFKVIVGGSWQSFEDQLRTGYRGARNPEVRDNTLGVRLIRIRH